MSAGNASNAGQVFFGTPNGLIDRDTDGQRDVYEYQEGTLSFVSSGTNEAGSYLWNATSEGSDVLFVTSQPLVMEDMTQLTAITMHESTVDSKKRLSLSHRVKVKGVEAL